MTDVELRDPAFTERYRAIAARDSRFDGQFFTAVRTTGIYCRPSCPARTPKAENVSFYLTSAAAHEAGFRACKRCLPEAAPGTPAWDLRSRPHGPRDALGGRRCGRPRGGDRAGHPPGLLRAAAPPAAGQRAGRGAAGAGPGAQRAQTARALLVGTSLRLADVAFAAGFGSIRQFNDTVAEVFGATPSDLRARARRAGRRPESAARESSDQPVRISLALPVREPFDGRGVLDFPRRPARSRVWSRRT